MIVYVFVIHLLEIMALVFSFPSWAREPASKFFQILFVQGKSGPDDGVLVFGLYLDGARWSLETKTLQDTLPMQRCCRLPELHFIPTTVSG